MAAPNESSGESIWKRVDNFLVHLFELEKNKDVKSPTNTNRIILELNSLIANDDFEGFDHLFVPGHPDGSVNSTSLVRLTEGLNRYASVPTFHGREDCGFETSDFNGVSEKAHSALKLFSTLLEKLSSSHKKSDKELQNRKPLICQKIALYGLLLIGQHSSNDLWTTEGVRAISKKLSGDLLKAMRCKSIFELLCEPPEGCLVSSGLFKQVMTEIKPRFQKDNWKRSPGIPRVFTWIMSNVKSPYMSDQIPTVLPPCLLLTDDHQPDYKVLGIQSLHLLMKECSHEEIRWYGRGEVIYEALQHQLYSTDPEVIEAALPAIFLILKINEGIPQTTPPPRPETRYDTILERLLQSMEMENLLVLRRIYARHLPAIMTHMGITLCRHMPSILRVSANYLEIFDGPAEEARFGALDILDVLIRATWPRIHNHSDEILKSLLKFVYDVSTDKTTTPKNINDDLICKATRCGMLLRISNPQKIDKLLCDVAHIDFSEACAKFSRVIMEQALE